MLIFIVADIWNCYNMDMKKATNLKVLIIFKQPHCMEIRNRLSLKQEVAQMANEDKKDFNAMLHDSKDMPKFQIIIDQKSIEKYGETKCILLPRLTMTK